jgi:hypothetical protein
MTADASPITPSSRPLWRRPRFWKRALPITGAAAAIIAGLVVYTVVYGSNGLPSSNIPLQKTAPTPKTVKLDPGVHSLILRFVKTAVAEKDPDVSYRLITPHFRQGLTLEQWRNGETTVVPYPVDAKTTLAYEKPDYSYARRARVQVHVVTPNEPKLTERQETNTFFVYLVKRDGRWLIDNWVPRWTPPIPTS